jgi:uncharacterized BrkB/YihY/UPF0761 family membrane protein
MMLWLYILALFIILFGAAVVINRRRRRSVSYDSEAAARLDHAHGVDNMRQFPGGE